MLTRRRLMAVAVLFVVAAAILTLCLDSPVLDRRDPSGAQPTPRIVTTSPGLNPASAEAVEAQALVNEPATEKPPAPAESAPATFRTVTVRCFDADTGHAISTFRVLLEQNSGRSEDYSAVDGECAIPAEFTSGSVRATGYEGVSLPAFSEEESEVACRLRPVGGLGLVLADGKPVAGVVVRYCKVHGTPAELEPTDTAGRFAFPVVTEGFAVELHVASDRGVGRVVCNPGQSEVTIHLVAGAQLRVVSDQPLPPLEVVSIGGIEAHCAGGAVEETVANLTPFAHVAVRRKDGTAVGKVQLGPPGSVRTVVCADNGPDIWLALLDERGSPIEWRPGMQARVSGPWGQSSPASRTTPPAVRLPLGAISFAGRHQQLDVLNERGLPAFRGHLGEAATDGKAWSLRMRSMHVWSGIVRYQGQPAAGARVAIGTLATEDAMLTDEAGRFAVSSMNPRLRPHAQWKEFTGVSDSAPGDGITIELAASRALEVRVAGAGRFGASWKIPASPWSAPVSASNGAATLHTPAADIIVQVRVGDAAIERAVAADARALEIDLAEGVEVEFVAEIAGQPRPMLEINCTPARPRGTPPMPGGPVTRVHLQTGGDGKARILLPVRGKWVYSTPIGGGDFDTSEQTTILIRSRSPQADTEVEVFGQLDWQPTMAEGLRLFQTDRPLNGLTRRGELVSAGAALVAVRDVAPGVLSYTATMRTDLPFVLLASANDWLQPAGVLARTALGWRCDITRDPVHFHSATLRVQGGPLQGESKILVIGAVDGRQEVLKFPLRHGDTASVQLTWPSRFTSAFALVLTPTHSGRAALANGADAVVLPATRPVVRIRHADPETVVALSMGAALQTDWVAADAGNAELLAFCEGPHTLLIQSRGREPQARAINVGPAGTDVDLRP